MSEPSPELQQLADVLELCGIGGACGVAGGLFSVLRRRKVRTLLSVVTGLASAAFAGSLAFMWIYEFSVLTLPQKVAISCVVGSLGEKAIDAVQRRISAVLSGRAGGSPGASK